MGYAIKETTKRPNPNQKCEICGKSPLPYCYDGRLRNGPHGPKGHWAYLCPSCHLVFGIGFDEDNLIIFKRVFQRFFEVKGEYGMTPEEVRNTVSKFRDSIRDNSSRENDAFIVLIGEGIIKLGEISTALNHQNEYLHTIAQHLTKADQPALENQITTEIDEES